MYHVVSTGIASIILYLISYVLFVSGFYSIQDHRRFWNALLALTFILTLAAGLLLALQITYKWNISFIKTVLKWHVECGIGMAFTGIFHFVWHISYFGYLFKKDRNIKIAEIKNVTGLTIRQLRFNLLIIGFTSTTVQLLLIREMMTLAGGYELIAGTFLGSWIFGSAIGTSAARKSDLNDIKKINIYFAGSVLLSLLFIILLTRVFLNPGETPSFLISIIITLISIFPVTFLSGFTFLKLITSGKQISSQSAGRSFSYETTGSIIGGILVSLLLGGLLNTYQLLILVIILNITYILIFLFNLSKPVRFTVLGLAVLIIVIDLSINPDRYFRQLFLGNINVLETFDTPYGNITTAEYSGERNIYYNQRLQSYRNDEMEREENIHYAMLQHDNPKNVLLISGDIRSNLKEVLKYDVDRIVFLERDPTLLRMDIVKNDSLTKKLEPINDDPLIYINRTEKQFDVILQFLPPPTTLQLNRFYTSEYFAAVRKALKNNGVFMCSPGSGEDYYSKESIILYSSIVNSLKIHFKNVVPVVGNKLYFISSDGDVTSSICRLLKERGIKNTYVNSDYLADDLMNKKSNDVMAIINPAAQKNTAEFPVACFHYQSYNLSKNSNERIPAIIILIIIFIIPAFSVKRRNLIMFSSAAALAGFEIIALLILQSVIGNMYLLTGIIIASLMSGLATGSYSDMKSRKLISIIFPVVFLALFYIGEGHFLMNIVSSTSKYLALIIILISVFIPAVFTGRLFNVLTRSTEPFSDPASVYNADLKGSAVGFVVTSGYLIPSMGISSAITVLSVFIVLTLLVGIIGNKY